MNAGHSVLVVDDDPDLRGTVADALEDDGIDVKVAENGRVALDMLLAGARPDVILLDLMMPEMDGPTFRAEQQKHPAIASIPVVVFSAYGMPDIAQRLGAHAYLRKPLRLDELLTTINRFRPDAPTNE